MALDASHNNLLSDKLAWPAAVRIDQKVLEVGVPVRKEEIDWLKRCAIGEATRYSLIGRLTNFLKEAGFLHCSVRYLEGLRVLVECAYSDDLHKLTIGDNLWLSDWFTKNLTLVS